MNDIQKRKQKNKQNRFVIIYQLPLSAFIDMNDLKMFWKKIIIFFLQ